MLRHAVSNFKFFDREMQATKALTRENVVTKRPMDIFAWKPVYEKIGTKFLINIRDPRSVLTSVHANSEGKWKVDWEYSLKTSQNGVCGKTNGLKDYWNIIYKVPNSMFVYYEDLIDRPNEVQERLKEFCGFEYKGKFSEFYKTTPPPLLTHQLNGLRPPDPETKYKWKKCPERIKNLIKKHPEILDMLIDLGYEKDKQWIRNL